MPDIFSVIHRQWKLIVLLTFLATVVAFIACLLSPKQYLSTTTALPVNSLLNDKARIFNQNIEALYPEIGTADELDKLEGTAKLDTLFLSIANDFHLAAHYNIDTTTADALDKAALQLKKHSNIGRTGYGELKIKVWDESNTLAAALANAFMQKINTLHQRLQSENNQTILQKLKEDYAAKLQAFNEVSSHNSERTASDSVGNINEKSADIFRQATLKDELLEYNKLINEYELALQTTPKVLLVEEQARPSPWLDKPKTTITAALTFLASLLFSFLLALFIESRRQKA